VILPCLCVVLCFIRGLLKQIVFVCVDTMSEDRTTTEPAVDESDHKDWALNAIKRMKVIVTEEIDTSLIPQLLNEKLDKEATLKLLNRLRKLAQLEGESDKAIKDSESESRASPVESDLRILNNPTTTSSTTSSPAAAVVSKKRARLDQEVSTEINSVVILAVDAEGTLYGDVFSIGCSMQVGGKEVDYLYLRANHEETKEFKLPAGNPRNRYVTLDGKGVEIPGYVTNNVIKALNTPIPTRDGKTTTSINVGSLKEMRSRFWSYYRACAEECKIKNVPLIVVGDWGSPIEAALFRACINDFEGDDFEKAQWQGPAPLDEVTSMFITLVFQYGMDRVKEKIDLKRRLPDTELPEHHPLADARQTARLAYECLSFKP
jgi:hypothetical protein